MDYTKGKWYLQEYSDAYTNIIRCDNGKGFETLYIGSSSHSTDPEARVNAKLMAKAPEMLEALKGIYAIKELLFYPVETKTEHLGEAIAVSEAITKIQSLINEIESWQ